MPDDPSSDATHGAEQSGGPSDPGEKFRLLLADGNVDIEALLDADRWRSLDQSENSAYREAGEKYYPQLHVAYVRKYRDAQIIVSGLAGMAIALGAGKPDEFEILADQGAMRFDWTEPGRLLVKINELAEEVRRWIPDMEERLGLLITLFGVASQILAAVARENDNAGSDTPSSLAGELLLIEPQIDRARQQYLDDAQRAAQLRYARGMAWGGLALLAISVIAGVGFFYWDLEAVNGIGMLAGGIGACVSVLQRMTSGTLVLNFQTVDRMLSAFGALRPLVGGVFGLVTFCVLDAGLISAIQLPSGAGEKLSFVAVFAFAAGFNERFFQDMLAKASQTSDVPSQTLDDAKAAR